LAGKERFGPQKADLGSFSLFSVDNFASSSDSQLSCSKVNSPSLKASKTSFQISS
jgi:hypothetical protein